MTAEVNLRQRLGDTWTIDAEVNTEAGANVDLTGATLSFELIGTTLVVGSEGIVITDVAAGAAIITVPPARQTAAGIRRAAYDYRFKAVLVNGTVSTQGAGVLSVE